MARSKKLSKRQMDADFEEFLKESVSSEDSSLDTARLKKYLEPKKKEEPWWKREQDISEDEDDADIGLSGTGSKFLKKKPTPYASGPPKAVAKSTSSGQDAKMSRDSLDDESLMSKKDEIGFRSSIPVPALSLGSTSMTDTMTEDKQNGAAMGKDTLDELADKENFFKDLKKNNATLDYSALNKDLDKSATLGGTQDSGEKTAFTKDNQNGCLSEEEDADDEYGERLGPATVNRESPSQQAGLTNGSRDTIQASQEKDAGMLAKVSLLDSLDSTLGTKPARSRDTGVEEDIGTIPEGTNEEHEREDEEEEEEDQVDGHPMGEDTDYKHTDTTTKGITLKGTGFGCTDTSREIEALHQALRNVGMETLTSTKDFTLKDSSTQRTQEMTEDGTQGTGGFGLGPVLPQSTDASGKVVDSLVSQVDSLSRQKVGSGGSSGHRALYTLQEDQTGGVVPEFGSSSVWPVGSRGLEYRDYNGADRFDFGGMSASLLDGLGLDGQSNIPVPAKRQKKPNVELEKSREKPSRDSGFTHVKSSGYGKVSPQKPPQKAPQKPAHRGHKPSKVTWSPAEMYQRRVKGTEETADVQRSLEKMKRKPAEDAEHSTPVASSGHQLVESVQSFAEYIQQHFTIESQVELQQQQQQQQHWMQTTDTPIFTNLNNAMDVPPVADGQRGVSGLTEREERLVKEAQEWQNQWQEEHRVHIKMKAEMAQLKQDISTKMEQQKKKHDEEIFRLKQENFVLAAKIPDESKPGKNKVVAISAATPEGAQADQVALLEREVREQEKLLAGYQQENERLYQEMKSLQVVSKATEERMFKENQKLATDVANMREHLGRKEVELRNKGVITSPAVQQQIAAGSISTAKQHISHLETQLKQAAVREESLELELQEFKQNKRDLERQVDDLAKQMDELVRNTAQLKAEAIREREEEHKKEVERLQKKLQWYAQNQQLLDRDSLLIKEKDTQLQTLKDKLELLQSETGRKAAETKAKGSQRTADAKRIQDLERQVREMENIVRKRHPNSLPVLMWAASTAQDPSENKALSVDFLEKQVRKLEKELESRDSETKRSLRVVEQKYNTMKCQYEAHIEELERQISSGSPSKEAGAKLAAVREQLVNLRDQHRGQLRDLQVQIDTLNVQLDEARASDKGNKNSEAGLCRQCGRDQSRKESPSQKSPRAQPQSTNGRVYQPSAFSGQHVADAVSENNSLKGKIESLEVDVERQRLYVQQGQAESEARERRLREEADVKLQTVKTVHQNEVQRLLTEHALHNSTSRLTELQGKADTQECVIKHLKEKAAHTQLDADKLSALRIREMALETQVKQLLDELREAKQTHTPEMRHFAALQDKVRVLEERHAQREHELQQVVLTARSQVSGEHADQVGKLKRLVEVKNRETEKFRMELESILDVIRELQRQGVILPLGTVGSANAFSNGYR